MIESEWLRDIVERVKKERSPIIPVVEKELTFIQKISGKQPTYSSIPEYEFVCNCCINGNFKAFKFENIKYIYANMNILLNGYDDYYKSLLYDEYYFAAKKEVKKSLNYDLRPSLSSSDYELSIDEIKYTIKHSDKIIQQIENGIKDNNITTEREKLLYLIHNFRFRPEYNNKKWGISYFQLINWEGKPRLNTQMMFKDFYLGLNFSKVYNFIQEFNSAEENTTNLDNFTNNKNNRVKYELKKYIFNFPSNANESQSIVKIINTEQSQFTLKFPNDIIEEVLFNPYINEGNKKLVIDLIKLKPNKPKLYQLKYYKKTDIINREEIEY